MKKIVFVALMLSFVATFAHAAELVCDEGDAVCLKTTKVFNTNDSAMVGYVKPHAKIALSDSAFSKFVTVEVLKRSELEQELLHKKYAIGPRGKVLATEQVQFAGTTATQSHVQKIVMGKKYDYLVIDFPSGDYYLIITGWTSNEEFAAYKDAILETMQTFTFKNRKTLSQVALEPW